MEKFLSRALKNDLLIKSEKKTLFLQRDDDLQYYSGQISQPF